MATFTKLAASSASALVPIDTFCQEFPSLDEEQVRQVFCAVGNPHAGLGLSEWLSLFEVRLQVSVRVALTETEDPFSLQKAILSKQDILTQLEPEFEREGMQRAKVQCPHRGLEGYVTLRANRGTMHVQSFPHALQNLALAEPVDLARSAAAAVTKKELKLQDEAMDRALGLLEQRQTSSPAASGSAQAQVRAGTRVPAARLLRNRRPVPSGTTGRRRRPPTPAVPSGTTGRRRYDSESVLKDRISPTRLVVVSAAVLCQQCFVLFNIPATLEVVTCSVFLAVKGDEAVYPKPQYPFRKLHLSL